MLPSELDSATVAEVEAGGTTGLDVGGLEPSTTYSGSIVVPKPDSVVADVDIVAVELPSLSDVEEESCESVSEDWVRILEAGPDVLILEVDSTCSGST